MDLCVRLGRACFKYGFRHRLETFRGSSGDKAKKLSGGGRFRPALRSFVLKTRRNRAARDSSPAGHHGSAAPPRW